MFNPPLGFIIGFSLFYHMTNGFGRLFSLLHWVDCLFYISNFFFCEIVFLIELLVYVCVHAIHVIYIYSLIGSGNTIPKRDLNNKICTRTNIF